MLMLTLTQKIDAVELDLVKLTRNYQVNFRRSLAADEELNLVSLPVRKPQALAKMQELQQQADPHSSTDKLLSPTAFRGSVASSTPLLSSPGLIPRPRPKPKRKPLRGNGRLSHRPRWDFSDSKSHAVN